MKIFLFSLLAVGLLVLLGLAFLSWRSVPQKLGLDGGRLAACASAENCVCSEHEGEAWVAPLDVAGDDPLAAVRQAVAVLGGAVESADSNYLHATFRSRLFRFVDDVEFRLDPGANVIHVRSASQAGRSDLGVNRRRVERIREQLGASPRRP